MILILKPVVLLPITNAADSSKQCWKSTPIMWKSASSQFGEITKPSVSPIILEVLWCWTMRYTVAKETCSHLLGNKPWLPRPEMTFSTTLRILRVPRQTRRANDMTLALSAHFYYRSHPSGTQPRPHTPTAYFPSVYDSSTRQYRYLFSSLDVCVHNIGSWIKHKTIMGGALIENLS